MNNRWLLAAGVFFFVVGLIAALALLTEVEEDPCADSGADVGAAVLGETEGDQEGLVNRAILVRGKCEPEEEPQ